MIIGPDAEYVYLRRLLHNFGIRQEREENDKIVNEKIKNMLMKKAGINMSITKANVALAVSRTKNMFGGNSTPSNTV